MSKFLVYGLISVCFLLSNQKASAQADTSSPSAVVARLIANASRKPPGPVENDLAWQVVKTAKALLEFTKDSQTLRENLAGDYSFFVLKGPLTPLYTNEVTGMFSAPVQLNDATLHAPDDLPFNSDGSPGFGPNVGGCMYLNEKVKPDGNVVATFCLVQEKGAWKVHNFYISNAPLNADQMKFIIAQLDLYAKKS